MILLAIVLIAVPLLPIPLLVVRFKTLEVKLEMLSKIEPFVAIKLSVPAVVPALMVPASISPLLAVKLMGLELESVLEITLVTVIVPGAVIVIPPLDVVRFVNVTALL